jgi:hypothetical protein
MDAFYGSLATLLVIAGSGHYLWQVLRQNIKPHFFTYLVWSIVTGIVAAGMVAKHVGPASWRTIVLAFFLTIGTLASLRNGVSYIRRFDIIVLILALMAIPVWIATKNPDFSIFWILVVETVGGIPALRKAWNLPQEEGVFGLFMNAASNIFALLALNHASLAITTYFITWGLLLTLLASIAVVRRGNFTTSP